MKFWENNYQYHSNVPPINSPNQLRIIKCQFEQKIIAKLEYFQAQRRTISNEDGVNAVHRLIHFSLRVFDDFSLQFHDSSFRILLNFYFLSLQLNLSLLSSHTLSLTRHYAANIGFLMRRNSRNRLEMHAARETRDRERRKSSKKNEHCEQLAMEQICEHFSPKTERFCPFISQRQFQNLLIFRVSTLFC